MPNTTLPAETFTHRVAQLQSMVGKLEGVLISRPSDVRYFTGIATILESEREVYLMVDRQGVVIYRYPLSPTSAVLFPAQWQVTPITSIKNLAALLAKRWPAHNQEMKLLIDADDCSVREYHQLLDVLPGCIQLMDRLTIWAQRMIKTNDEQAAITLASSNSRAAVNTVIGELILGISEIAVRDRLDGLLKKHPSDHLAFPTIVAFGQHSAIPHHQPGATRLEPETPVLIDCGAKEQDYCADMTRTIWFGTQPSAAFVQTEQLVMKAYAVGLAALRAAFPTTSPSINPSTSIALIESIEKHQVDQPAFSAADLDIAVRQVLVDAQRGDQFIHTSGHGLGLDIHEPPSLSKSNPIDLKTGMVITIEPGLYLPGEFGYRYENTIILTTQGIQIPTA